MKGSIRMAVHRRRRGGLSPPAPPPPPDQSDHRGKKRNLQWGKHCRAIFGTQNFGSQTPIPPASPSSNTSLTCANCGDSSVLLNACRLRTSFGTGYGPRIAPVHRCLRFSATTFVLQFRSHCRRLNTATSVGCTASPGWYGWYGWYAVGCRPTAQRIQRRGHLVLSPGADCRVVRTAGPEGPSSLHHLQTRTKE